MASAMLEVIGAVVEAISHGVETPITATAQSLTAAACASLIYKWLKGRSTAPVKKALARHYAVFSQ